MARPMKPVPPVNRILGAWLSTSGHYLPVEGGVMQSP